MFHKPVKREKKQNEDSGYWLSISDLMAGVLIVFILLFVIKLNTEAKVKRVFNELYQKRETVVDKIKDKFHDKHQVEVQEDGTLRFKISDKGKAEGWFKEGSSVLQSIAKEELTEILPGYFNILISTLENDSIFIDNDVHEKIDYEVIVEGHTDKMGKKGAKTELDSYLYNLELSQKRAFSVSTFIQKDLLFSDSNHRLILQKRLAANGKSYTHLLVNDSTGEVDPVASRRVEVRFKINNYKLFKSMHNVLSLQDSLKVEAGK
ncbi:MAG: OmpA family protein [Fibrobacterales bacterium]